MLLNTLLNFHAIFILWYKSETNQDNLVFRRTLDWVIPENLQKHLQLGYFDWKWNTLITCLVWTISCKHNARDIRTNKNTETRNMHSYWWQKPQQSFKLSVNVNFFLKCPKIVSNSLKKIEQKYKQLFTIKQRRNKTFVCSEQKKK